MKILAVEFSSSLRSVAVVEGSKVLGNAIEIRGRRAISLVEEALARAQVEREEVEAIAIGLGPGSYTGIRGAIALAQGWQLGRATKLLGISSVECIAAGAQRAGIRGAVNIIIDAQRDEFYLAGFEIDERSIRPTQDLRLASLAEIQRIAGGGGRLLPTEMLDWFPTATLVYPAAATLGELAAGREDFTPGEKLEPIYLRETSFKKAPPPRIHLD